MVRVLTRECEGVSGEGAYERVCMCLAILFLIGIQSNVLSVHVQVHVFFMFLQGKQTFRYSLRTNCLCTMIDKVG